MAHLLHFTEEETEACEVTVLSHWWARPWKFTRILRGYDILSFLRNSVGKLGLHVATCVGTGLSVFRSNLVNTCVAEENYSIIKGL